MKNIFSKDVLWFVTYYFLRLTKFDRFVPDEPYLKLKYRCYTGKKLNLNPPKTFNEKLQWLKLHDHNPLYTTLVDKYAVKKWVANKIGDEYVIPTIGVWDDVKDIDFDSLPNQFVLKCTHDSGGIVICKDKSKLDIEAAKQKLKKSLKNNFYLYGREWPYKNVPRKIIAEVYMTDDGDELKDYKIFTFNGEPRIIQIDYNRYKGHLRSLFDTNWELMDAQIAFKSDPNRHFEKPNALSKLLELSRKLACSFSHVRTDFYIVDEKIYFGELTFYHGTGMEKITPETLNEQMGDWIKLPQL